MLSSLAPMASRSSGAAEHTGDGMTVVSRWTMDDGVVSRWTMDDGRWSRRSGQVAPMASPSSFRPYGLLVHPLRWKRKRDENRSRKRKMGRE